MLPSPTQVHFFRKLLIYMVDPHGIDLALTQHPDDSIHKCPVVRRSRGESKST